MYFACFEGEEGDWLQAAARIGGRPSSGAASNWNWTARQLSEAMRLDGATVVRRIELDSGRRLRQLIGITVPKKSASRVREIVARMTRTERITGTSFQLAQSPEERDEWFGYGAEPQFCCARERFLVKGLPIACDFRVLPFLGELLVDAALAGYAVDYRLHLKVYQPDPEHLRAARKMALALLDLPGASAELLQWQGKMAHDLAQACVICEEYLSAGSPEATVWLEGWLSDRFKATYARFGFSALPPPRADVYEDALTTGLHSDDFEPWSCTQLCGNALSAEARDAMLQWQPSRELEALIARDDTQQSQDGPDVSDAPIAPGVGPCTYDGEEVFAFASYKRQDIALISPMMQLVREWGVPLWYDAHIPGGSEWDEVIEDRLARAKFIIVFSSKAAMESKYVRREIKYADARDRPVLTVMLEDVVLRYGLEMLLTQYQTLDARAENFQDRFKLAVRELFA